VTVEQGQAVQVGDVVARLRSEAETAQLALARARAESDAQISAQQATLELATASRLRIAELQSRNVASTAQLEEAEAELETARMNLRLAELQKELDLISLQEAEVNLALREIRSPIDGVVTDLNRGPGERVSQEGHVLTLAQIDPLFVRALLPVDVYGATAADQTVEVQLGLPVSQTLTARITVIDKVLNAAAGTFGIRAEIENADGAIPAGQTCTLSLGQS
jgi:RND family efflux transporter MFP subunit